MIGAAVQTAVIRVLILVAGFVTTVITARELGPSGRGQFYLVVIVGALAVQFGNLGLHASNSYLAAHDRTLLGSLVTNSAWISLVCGSAAGLLIAWVAGYGARSDANSGSLLYWAAAFAPFGLFVLLASQLLLGIGRVTAYNALQLATSVLTVAGVVAAALADLALSVFVAVPVVAAALTAVLAFVLVSRGQQLQMRFDRATFDAGVRFASRAYIVALLGFFVLRANVLVLGYLAAPQELGYYSVASQFVDVLVIVPASVSAVLFPRLVGSSSSWPQTLRWTRWTTLFMLGACVIVLALVEPLVVIMFGSQFVPAVDVVRWSLPAVVFISVASVLSQYLAAQGFPRSVLLAWLGAAVVMLALAAVLVPRFGALGAAIALCATYGLLTLLIWRIAFAMGASSRAAANSEQ